MFFRKRHSFIFADPRLSVTCLGWGILGAGAAFGSAGLDGGALATGWLCAGWLRGSTASGWWWHVPMGWGVKPGVVKGVGG